MSIFSPNPEINHNNQSKHGLSLTTAQLVFNDPYLLSEEYDEKHSEDEHRYYAFGMLPNGRIIKVNYTMRNDMYRLITAREATREEKRIYAEHIRKELNL